MKNKMKTIETELGLEYADKLTLEELEEVVSNLKKLYEQPSSCKEARYRHILAYGFGWRFSDGTRRLLYLVRYQNNKEEPHSESLKIEHYRHRHGELEKFIM